MPDYMKFPGINGNAKGRWTGWIQLISVSMGVKKTSNNKPDVYVVKTSDSTSLQLVLEAESGEARDIEIVMVTGDDAPHVHVELKAAIISSFHVGRTGDGYSNYEQFSFSYEKMTISPQARSTPKNAKDAEHAAKAGWAASP
ncbi:MAG: type VI secretion system tube protein Hcp [Aridibacter famidurans]|nr:type VI secretion system tube protein Hcp [Aridibacter famidurans]